jgi:hypothetical protein
VRKTCHQVYVLHSGSMCDLALGQSRQEPTCRQSCSQCTPCRAGKLEYGLEVVSCSSYDRHLSSMSLLDHLVQPSWAPSALDAPCLNTISEVIDHAASNGQLFLSWRRMFLMMGFDCAAAKQRWHDCCKNLRDVPTAMMVTGWLRCLSGQLRLLLRTWRAITPKHMAHCNSCTRRSSSRQKFRRRSVRAVRHAFAWRLAQLMMRCCAHASLVLKSRCLPHGIDCKKDQCNPLTQSCLSHLDCIAKRSTHCVSICSNLEVSMH